MVQRVLRGGYRAGRKVCVAVLGSAVVAAGVLMVVLPGPAILVIPLGLGILALEFAWARRWLQSLRDEASRLRARVRS